MELVRGLQNIREKHRGCVLTIGKFDGVHLGHKAVLSSVIAKARELKLPATVMVFEPQPEELFNPTKAPARLSRLRDKYSQLRALGVDRLLCIQFDQHFAQLSAQRFVDDLLVEKLGVKFLVVGDDFKFGNKRAGNFAMLEAKSRESGFDVVSTNSYRLQDCRISSSAIRDALLESDFNKAEAMLGRAFSISGKVIHGDKKGRTIGFPTANLLLKRCKSPVSGVFAVEVIIEGKIVKGVANIGNRPTVKGQRQQLEVHLFNYSQQLYGQRIEVVLKQKIRNEIKFESFAELEQQIHRDAAQAQKVMGL